MTTKLDSDFRSYLQDMAAAGRECDELLASLLKDQTCDSDIADDMKEIFIDLAKGINDAMGDIFGQISQREESRAEQAQEKGKEFSADLMYAGDA